MIVPVTNAAAEIGVALRRDIDIEMLADVPRLTDGAQVGLILLLPLKYLHHMTYNSLTSVDGYRRGRSARTLRMGQPIR